MQGVGLIGSAAERTHSEEEEGSSGSAETHFRTGLTGTAEEASTSSSSSSSSGSSGSSSGTSAFYSCLSPNEQQPALPTLQSVMSLHVMATLPILFTQSLLGSDAVPCRLNVAHNTCLLLSALPMAMSLTAYSAWSGKTWHS